MGESKNRLRAVFLDRDGVLNRALVRDGRPYPPRRPEHLELLPGVVDACAQLKRAGLLLIVVTNQPDVARGDLAESDLAAINDELRRQLALDRIVVCSHDGDGCDCRKPKPGMLTATARELGIDLGRSVMVGDRWRDIEAGRLAGCWTVLVDHRYDERRVPGDLTTTSLLEAVPWIVAHTQEESMTLCADKLKVKIFGDGADREGILALAKNPLIKGFTTNPTLMRKAGVTNYEAFARDVLKAVPDRPFSFEVLSDDPVIIEEQAVKLASWGSNVFVKIPITNTAGESLGKLVGRLAKRDVKVNVTAITTLEQVKTVTGHLAGGPPCNVSVFAGRIADTGVDPVPVMKAALEIIAPHKNIELIWASPRELLNLVQADSIGCHIITVTHDILKKLSWLGRDLAGVSLETVKMFVDDAKAAGLSI